MRSRAPRPALLAGALLAAALSGCAGSCPPGGPCGATPAAGADAASRGDLVCTNETVTGSRIVERRCQRRTDLEERQTNDRAAAERLLIKSNTPVTEP